MLAERVANEVLKKGRNVEKNERTDQENQLKVVNNKQEK